MFKGGGEAPSSITLVQNLDEELKRLFPDQVAHAT